MSARPSTAVAIATAVSTVLNGCGSRSALLERGVVEAGAPDGAWDAGAHDGALDPCVPPELAAECVSAIANAPAGDEVWQAVPAVGDLDLLGPVAANRSGATYYLGAEQALYVKTVSALDACGNLRWQTDVASLFAGEGYVAQVMATGSRLLLVSIPGFVVRPAEADC